MNNIITGDALSVLRTLEAESLDCCVTSPPYWGLRDYGVPGQLGLERTPEEYVARMVELFREVKRVLKPEGTLWLNLGDSYARMQEGNVPQSKNLVVQPPMMAGRVKNAGLKPKDLVGIPWRVAFALQADGWYLRSDIIWHKPNPMPESVRDRPTKAHEYLFLLAKSERYFYDADAIKEPAHGPNRNGFRGELDGPTHYANQPRSPHNSQRFEFNGKHRNTGPQTAARRMLLNVKTARDNGAAHDQPFGNHRNRRTVWTITTRPFKGAHFATFPEKLIEPCILAGCPEGGTVLDPFFGAGTTGVTAKRLNRNCVGIELNPAYVQMARERIGLLKRAA